MAQVCRIFSPVPEILPRRLPICPSTGGGCTLLKFSRWSSPPVGAVRSPRVDFCEFPTPNGESHLEVPERSLRHLQFELVS
jgi:hypothetical protein